MKKFKGLLLAGVALASVAFSAQKAEASNGNIMDGDRMPIVGIWVEVHGGKSGWANFRPTTPGQKYSVAWNYDTQNKPFELHIGVGGTPQKWKYSIHTRVFKRNTYGGQINIIPGTTNLSITGMP